ncbi:cystatin-like [Crotalus tigris]|uniref:cystatin-like n=1 Tax=Crotalus tigris TaxID=88082 RepID=UPI00192F4446|nr:cystatin-like [Crotalus tigris]
MVHSQLPVLSLLCLLCWALLLLPPESQGVISFPGEYSKVHAKNPGLKKALAFVVPQYNQDMKDEANYFKMHTVSAGAKEYKGRLYYIKAIFLNTACKKTAGKTMTFKEIQQCKQRPGKPEKQTCYLKVICGPKRNEQTLTIISCS